MQPRRKKKKNLLVWADISQRFQSWVLLHEFVPSHDFRVPSKALFYSVFFFFWMPEAALVLFGVTQPRSAESGNKLALIISDGPSLSPRSLDLGLWRGKGGWARGKEEGGDRVLGKGGKYGVWFIDWVGPEDWLPNFAHAR